MAKRDSATKSKRIAAEALKDPGIADGRKELATFQVICDLLADGDGKIKPEHTGAIVGAVMLDWTRNKINRNDIAAISKGLDEVLKEDQQNIQRDLIAMQLESRARLANSRSSGDPRIYEVTQ